MGIATHEFEYLRKLVRDHSAIVLDADKAYLAESRLAGIATSNQCRTVSDLIFRLRTEPFHEAHGRVLDAMTNNETWFFRDLGPFLALERVIIPELLKKRAAEKRMRFWSAAASSGQEAYSVAMLLHSKFNLPGWDYVIRGTDISASILERARIGKYTQMEVNRGLPAALLARYFHREGCSWFISAEIKKKVAFESLNLAESWPTTGSFDVIFLRNVLIYLDMDTRRKILARVRQVLRPDGYLFLGCAESMLNLDDSFERIQFESSAYYRLKGQGR
ncbi:protein-glutamate O-methyltransferase CheR [Acidobacteria bacterium AB60]|nr:protein-glutamate O-methyltransferase CheR [Acidobacteria bacterium AB60]